MASSTRAGSKSTAGRFWPLLLLLSLAGLMPLAQAHPLLESTHSEDQEPSLAPVVEKALPSVVNISTVTHISQHQHPLLRDPFFRRFFDLPQLPERRRESSSLGSGVIIDADQGYIVTNHHVIERADEISVTLKDGRHLEATLVGSDSEADIAILQIEAHNLTEIPLGERDNLEVGDLVIAIGNPFGLSHTVTSGIISALGRTGLGLEGYEDFIQTDASINPGNSGGALIDWQGKLVGINTAIMGPSGGNVGIGFAIPVDMVRSLSNQIIKHGEVQRGWLGVYIQDLNHDLMRALDLESPEGALISQVMENSPAQEAGLREGDVIIALNGEPIRNSAELRNRIGLMRPEGEVNITYLRKGKRRTTSVELEERNAITTQNGRWQHQALPGAWLTEAPDEAPVKGVQVVEIEPGTATARAGLRRGDIIDRIDQHNVTDSASAREALDSAGRSVLLRIIRGRSALFLVVSR